MRLIEESIRNNADGGRLLTRREEIDQQRRELELLTLLEESKVWHLRKHQLLKPPAVMPQRRAVSVAPRMVTAQQREIDQLKASEAVLMERHEQVARKKASIKYGVEHQRTQSPKSKGSGRSLSGSPRMSKHSGRFMDTSLNKPISPKNSGVPETLESVTSENPKLTDDKLFLALHALPGWIDGADARLQLQQDVLEAQQSAASTVLNRPVGPPPLTTTPVPVAHLKL